MPSHKEQLAQVLSKATSTPVEKLMDLFEVPKDTSHGDLALPCFLFAKEMQKPPVLIAKDLAAQVNDAGIDGVTSTAIGPFLNFTIETNRLANEAIHGKLIVETTEPKRIVLDYSAPNVAKPFGIGHLRSTVIGQANKNILEALGHTVIGLNYIGDWGTQFGKVICAYEKWGDEQKFQENPVDYLLELYVLFHKEAETDESLNDEARRIFSELEQGNEAYHKLWTLFREKSIERFEKTYELLNVNIDEYKGEAYYNDKIPIARTQLEEKKLLTESQGAQIIDFEARGQNIPPIIMIKSNGSTTYAIRDVASAIDRQQEFNADILLYEVGVEQELHFQQVFATLKLMGFETQTVHLSHGHYKFEGKKFSTRKGNFILMEDVLHESIDKVKEVIKEKNPDLASNEEQFNIVATQVGVGAITFYDLKHDRIKGFDFSWDKVLDFQGETGPYIQYSYARTRSIIAKSEMQHVQVTTFTTLSDKEKQIVSKIASFNKAVHDSAKQYKPHILAQYLLQLTQTLNKYYAEVKVLNPEDSEDKITERIFLLSTVANTIKEGLSLLGIQSPERM